MVRALGVTWILDGLEVTMVGSLAAVTQAVIGVDAAGKSLEDIAKPLSEVA
ncbi:MAG: hypothetical protein PHT60_08290 [Acidiphilium sp.]|nr:hypothetical protein [Acidiphilium sp.]MDD4935761.1 hypothetical protein [Acidiphilium sp.]